MNPDSVADQAQKLSDSAAALAAQAHELAGNVSGMAASMVAGGPSGEFWYLLTIFVLAVFVGFYVVWSVTPALHSPLMAVTNAVSSVIIVGAILAAGPAMFGVPKVLGFLAVVLASVNIFGGFIVTQRMLEMFKRKDR
jgi:H+-translocating NAD(P) transhydrogenase subunit alpha